MFQSKLRFVLLSLLFLVIHGFPGGGHPALAQEEAYPEVGGSSPATDDDTAAFDDLEILDSRFDISAQYNYFTGEDMQDTYGGMPLVCGGFSFQTTRTTRFFVSLGYGEAEGNPFNEIPGISTADRIQVRYLPLLLGMKADLARSTRIQVFLGAAVEVAWMEETVPVVDGSGKILNQASSDINTGYQVTFGPQFMLGQGGQALGMEIGWGGSKGDVASADHKHDLDMTGLRGRLYVALAL